MHCAQSLRSPVPCCILSSNGVLAWFRSEGRRCQRENRLSRNSALDAAPTDTTRSLLQPTMASPHGSDYDDDAAIEEAVAKDAFGLSSLASSSKTKITKDGKVSTKNRTADSSSSTRKALVTNPDVLTEVCPVARLSTARSHRSALLDTHVFTFPHLAGLIETLYFSHHTPYRYSHEHQPII